MSAAAEFVDCGRVSPARRSISTGSVKFGAANGWAVSVEGRHDPRTGRDDVGWRMGAESGSLGRLSACRIPGLRLQHMHNPPVAESLQPF